MSPISPPAGPLRLALRRQRRSAAATMLIVLTLALALGANAAVVGVADTLLFRAVPYPDPGRLLLVTSGFPTVKLSRMNLSGPEALELQVLTTAFEASGPLAFTGLVVQGAAQTELASGVEISQGALTALRVAPVRGRPFAAADFHPGGPPIALLGYGLWTRAFGADPSVVGRTVQLGGVSREVVGIMPDGLNILNSPVDVWLPLALTPTNAGGRSDHRFTTIARIAGGRTLADATADVRRAMDVWREETGEMHTPHARMHPLELQPLTAATTGLNREPIAALLAAVAFVLLIACANISNLLVARAEQRRAEIAIQLALGATRARLLGESVAEGLLLALLGGVAGVGVAWLLIDALRAIWPAAATANLSLDPRVLAASALVTVVVGIIVGIAPAARLDVVRASEWLKAGTRGGVGGPSRRLQNGLIAVQISLAVLLSGAAGLMMRSLQAVTSIDPGFRTENVLRAQVSLPAGAYPEDPQVWTFYERLLSQLRTVPGVTHAAVMSGLPPQRRANNTSFLRDGVETMDHSSILQVDFVQHISPDYLRTMGIDLRDGRQLTDADSENAQPVALVNETLARSFWPNESAIGHRLKPAGNIGTWFTIVGVVADVRQNGIQSAAGTEIYVPHRQARRLMNGYMPRTMNVVLRSAASGDVVVPALRAALRGVDPSAALSGVFPMETIVNRTIAQPRLLALLFGGFAVLAVVVAGIGVYAVTSYAVGTRTSEFGLRMALGATPRDVMRLVVRGGLLTIAAGVAVGCAGMIAGARLLSGLLFSVQPLDPLSIAGGAAAMALAALLAAVLPAARAARVDPMTALRD